MNRQGCNEHLNEGKCGKAERTDSEKDVSGGAWQRLFSQQRISKGAVRTLFEKQLDLSILREPLASCDFSGGPGPRGNTLIFFFIRRLGPSIYCLPPPPLQKQTTKQKKTSGISSTPKKYLKFLQPQKYPNSVYLL